MGVIMLTSHTDYTDCQKDRFVTLICLFGHYGGTCSYVGDGDKPFLAHLRGFHLDNKKAQEYADKLEHEIRNTEILLNGH